MPKNPDTPRNVAVGCLMTPLGAFSGAMVAVLLSKIVAYLTKAPTCPDIPTCNWYVYAGWGALVGALTLPSLVLWQLLRSRRPGSE
jgi:hypothetical protein